MDHALIDIGYSCFMCIGLEMDIRDLKFPDQSFDVVIDKGIGVIKMIQLIGWGIKGYHLSGTMDALMCDRGDVWDPSPELIADVKGEVDEVERVTKIGGVFLYITFGQPHFRKRHLARDCWDIQVKTLGEAFHYFFYVMRKTSA